MYYVFSAFCSVLHHIFELDFHTNFANICETSSTTFQSVSRLVSNKYFAIGFKIEICSFPQFATLSLWPISCRRFSSGHNIILFIFYPFYYSFPLF